MAAVLNPKDPMKGRPRLRSRHKAGSWSDESAWSPNVIPAAAACSRGRQRSHGRASASHDVRPTRLRINQNQMFGSRSVASADPRPTTRSADRCANRIGEVGDRLGADLANLRWAADRIAEPE